MVRYALLISGLLAASTAAPHAFTPLSNTPKCGPVDDSRAQGLLAFAKNMVLNEKFSRSRENVGIPATTADKIAFVQNDSLCARAAAVINRDRGHAGTGAQRVYLLRVGVVYWVEDPTYMAGEYIRGLVIDSTFTTVLGRPGR